MKPRRVIYTVERKNGTLCVEPYNGGFAPSFSLITTTKEIDADGRVRTNVKGRTEADTLEPILHLLKTKMEMHRGDKAAAVTVRIQNYSGRLHHGDAALLTEFMLAQLDPAA